MEYEKISRLQTTEFIKLSGELQRPRKECRDWRKL